MTIKVVSSERIPWMSVAEASATLGVREVTLRRTLERHARRRPDGSVTASVDGVHARKFQRQWRVALDRTWLEHAARQTTGTNG